MRSKASFVRIQSVEEVRASLAVYGEGIAERLQQRRERPVREGEPTISYKALFEDLDQDLSGIRAGLVEAEDDHVRKRIQVSETRRSGEELTTELYDYQVAVRRTLAGLYGPDRGFEIAAVSGDTPRRLTALVDQVDQTAKLLRNPEVDLPRLAVDGIDINLESMVGRLESGMEEIRQVRARFERARKAAGETLILRNNAIEEFDRVFPWVARTLESLFRLIGERDLADRIRTSVRRVTRRQGAGDGEEETQEASKEGSESQPSDSTSPETSEPAATPQASIDA